MPRVTLTLRLGLLALGALAGACVPALNQTRSPDPQVEMPEAYVGDATAGAATAEAASAEASWSAFFEDPQLVALIEEALEKNQELEILRQEIGIASTEVMARRGEIFPRVGFGATAGVEKVGRYTSQGASDATTDIEPGVEMPENLGIFEVGFQASWEVDIWKKLRNASKAAQRRYLGSIEGRNFMVTQLVEEIASTYYGLMALDNQLQVVERNVALMADSLKVVKLQKEAARVTELAVQRFEAELLKSQSRRYDLRQQITVAENRINVLCGRFPQSVPRRSEGFIALELPAIDPGIPPALLENRPDIRQAERALEAAHLDVEVARALFYPALSIDAELGYEAYALKRLPVTPRSLLYAVSGHLLAPLFNRKAIKAQYFAAGGMEMQAVVSYERTVLEAYIEVTNQLNALENLGQRYAYKSQQVDVLEAATETSSGLFRSARADYLEVLTTRREALESEMERIETKQEQLEARIALYQALGGGWRGPDAPTE